MQEEDKKIINGFMHIVVAVAADVYAAFIIQHIVMYYNVPLELTLWQWFGVLNIVHLINYKVDVKERLSHWSNRIFFIAIVYSALWLILWITHFLV